ncbi:outer membrane protein transport protein [Larkinella harenae]
MKNSICIVGLLLYAGSALGQADIYAGDAFRYSEITQTGTARMRALGGNHASIGGDASSVFGNPAGLGFYNRSEISLSPSLNITSAQATYIGSQTSNSMTKPGISQFGVVLAGNKQNENRRWRRTALGITYNRQVQLSNNFVFEGRNNRSSIVDSYIVDANRRNLTGNQINSAYNSSTNEADFPSAAAYQLFLINGTVTPQDPSQGGPPYFRYDPTAPTQQRNTYQSSGGHSQWTIGYAGNLDDKLYIGASLGLTRLRFDFENVYRETVVGGAVFDNYSQIDNFTVTGNGINFSLGMIYKPDRNLQIGATLATPTFTSVRETFEQSLRVVARDPNLSQRLDRTEVFVVPNNFEYSITTPFRASGGLTYFLGGGKLGFITATADYVGYGGMRATTSVYNTQDNTDFKNDVKNEVQRTYKNVVNLRAGAEIRAGLLRIRGGVAYLPDAYKQQLNNIDRTRLLLSGGLGVRTDRFFVDASGTYGTTKSAYTPYTLPNASDYASAQIDTRMTNVTLSVGAFF